MLFLGAGQTGRVTTGNVRTTYDPFTPSPLASSPGATPNPFNGLACPLGSVIVDQGGPDSVSGTLTQLPNTVGGLPGAYAIYKYVLYKSATNGALVNGPGVVYYTDNTSTVVSGTLADGVTGKAPDTAGIMMINTTDLSTITATILNNGANGSGVWICIGGFVKAHRVGAAATGDYLYGSAGSFLNTNVADGAAAPTHMPYATAVTAAASNLADVIVRMGIIAVI